VGAAIAERMMAARFGRSLVDHSTWLISDTESLQNGASREAALFAARQKLNRLTLLIPAETGAEIAAEFASMGWTVKHPEPGMQDFSSAVSAAMRSRRPSLILCPALKIPSAPPSESPPLAWGRSGARASIRRAWLKRLARHSYRGEFLASLTNRPPIPSATPENPCDSPAAIAQSLLTGFATHLPGLSGMSAQLPLGQSLFTPTTPQGRAIAWSGLTQAMGAALCGMSLHRGLIPICMLSLEEAESLRPHLRCAAQNRLPIVLALIEPEQDLPGFGLRSAWRSLVGVTVFRPADSAETHESLTIALRQNNFPAVLMLSQSPSTTPTDRRVSCAQGAYLRSEPPSRDLTLIASGPELELAMQTATALAADGLHAAVISIPCWGLFCMREKSAREAVLGAAPRFAMERGSGFGIERFLAGGKFLSLSASPTAATLSREIKCTLEALTPPHPSEATGIENVI